MFKLLKAIYLHLLILSGRLPWKITCKFSFAPCPWLVHLFISLCFFTSILKSLVILVRFYKMVPFTFAVLGANCTLNTFFFYCNSEISSFLGHCNWIFERLKHLYSIFLCFFRCLLPAGADYNLLGVARILEMHGIILYPAKVRHSFEMLNILDLNWMEENEGKEK